MQPLSLLSEFSRVARTRKAFLTAERESHRRGERTAKEQKENSSGVQAQVEVEAASRARGRASRPAQTAACPGSWTVRAGPAAQSPPPSPPPRRPPSLRATQHARGQACGAWGFEQQTGNSHAAPQQQQRQAALTDEVDAGVERAACGNQVVHQHHALARLDVPLVHLNRVSAVLGHVALADLGACDPTGRPGRATALVSEWRGLPAQRAARKALPARAPPPGSPQPPP